ncbi:MAG: chemotaxis protein CheX [Planctomycetota bacterium]
MSSAYILPFVESVNNVFETMMQMPVTVGEPAIKPHDTPADNVSGIIGMTGDVDGTVVLGFPTATAERAVAVFTGMEIAADHEDFADAIGELVNMISGGAKAKFVGKHADISCPSVVIGAGHSVFGRKDVKCVRIPCECDLGEFYVDVAIRDAEEVQQAAAA